MSNRSILTFTVYIFLSSASAFGASTATSSLADVIHDVWAVSPQLAGQREQVNVSKDDVWRRYLINEPQLLLGSTDSDSGHSFGLGLTVPFPGKSIALGETDRAHRSAAQAELQAKRYDLTKTIVQAYLDCASAGAALAVQKQTTADLQSLSRSLETLYEAGHSSQAEKIGSQLQARQSEWDLQTAVDRQASTCRKYQDTLAKIKGDPSPQGDLSEAPPLPDDLDPSTLSDLGNFTADQLRAESAREVAHSAGSVATWAQMPDISLTVLRNDYTYLPASPNGKAWTTSASLAVTLPIFYPFSENIESRRARSQAQIDQNAALLQTSAADADQDDAIKDYARSRRRLKELRAQDLVLAKALVDSTYAEYRSAHLGYAELILSRRTLADLRNQDFQLRVEIINSHLRCLSRCGEASHEN